MRGLEGVWSTIIRKLGPNFFLLKKGGGYEGKILCRSCICAYKYGLIISTLNMSHGIVHRLVWYVWKMF